MSRTAAIYKDLLPSVPKGKVGVPFCLIIVYLFMEYVRPVNPLKIPMLISVLLFIGWMMLPKKHWSPQIICFAGVLAIIGVMGPFALNNYSIFWGFVGMVVELFCICVPIMHFVDSEQKLKWFIDAFVVMFVYIAIFAMLHSGFGPGGHVSDENDTALALNCAIPFAMLSIFTTEKYLMKLLYGAASAILVAGVIASKSRGGFVGLVCVLFYCFLLTPNKLRSLGIGVVLSIGVAALAPDSYWSEISSIGDEAANDDPRRGTGALRKLYWALAMEMFYANPLLGVGLGNFPYNAEIYQTVEMVERLGKIVSSEAHSLYFTILAELGALGALVFSIIVYYNFRDLRRLISMTDLSKRGPPQSPNARTAWGKGHAEARVQAEVGPSIQLKPILYYSHATRAGLIGFLSSGVFLSVFTYPHFWILTAITVVLVILTDKQVSPPTSRPVVASSPLSSRPLPFGVKSV